MSKTFTKADVASHKDEKNGMYIIIDDGVYDVAGMCSGEMRALKDRGD